MESITIDSLIARELRRRYADKIDELSVKETRDRVNLGSLLLYLDRKRRPIGYGPLHKQDVINLIEELSEIPATFYLSKHGILMFEVLKEGTRTGLEVDAKLYEMAVTDGTYDSLVLMCEKKFKEMQEMI